MPELDRWRRDAKKTNMKKMFLFKEFFCITHPGNIYLAFPPIWSEERDRNSTDSNWEGRTWKSNEDTWALSPHHLPPLSLSLPYLLINNCPEITRGTLNVYTHPGPRGPPGQFISLMYGFEGPLRLSTSLKYGGMPR